MAGLISKPKGKQAIIADYLKCIEDTIKNGNSSREDKMIMINNISNICIESIKNKT